MNQMNIVKRKEIK